MKRNASIELYRLFMMFCICLLHCSQQGGRFEETEWIYYLTRFSVVGFVFISGYFGINGGGRKILKLIAICVWCAALSVALRYATYDEVDWHMFGSDLLYSVTKGYWFLWTYIALMLLSPVLNVATEGDVISMKWRALPLFILVFGWSYLGQIPGVKSIVPMAIGFGPLSVLTLAAVYVCARIVRVCKYDEWMTWRRSIVILAITIPVCSLGFSHYNSIYSLLLAFALFCLFKRLPVWSPLGRIVIFAAPSMFSVYILHQCYRGFSFIGLGMRYTDFISRFPAAQVFFAAIFVFVSCVMVDLVGRRGLLWLKGRK